MAKLFYILLLVFLCFSFNMDAQQKGSVSLHTDPRLSLLLGKTKIVEKPELPAHTGKQVISKKNTKGAVVAIAGNEDDNDRERVPKYIYNPENETDIDIVTEKVKNIKKEHAATAIALVPAKITETKTAGTKTPTPRLVKDLPHEERHAVNGMSNGPHYSGKGFRVQIYNGPNRAEALRRKAEFMRNYPGVNTYLIFSTPHYRVKVGDYRRREDALGMYKEANGTYNPCMIVPDEVSVRKN